MVCTLKRLATLTNETSLINLFEMWGNVNALFKYTMINHEKDIISSLKEFCELAGKVARGIAFIKMKEKFESNQKIPLNYVLIVKE